MRVLENNTNRSLSPYVRWAEPNKFWLILLLLLGACNPPTSDKLQRGKELAEIFCSSCHSFPNPDLLPRSSWQTVLPMMGARLGVNTTYDPFANKPEKIRYKLKTANLYPESPMLSDQQWKKIEEYFYHSSPDSFKLPKTEFLDKQSLFQSHFPEINTPGPPAITFVEFDSKTSSFYIGDVSGRFSKYQQDFSIDYELKLPRPIIDIDIQAEGKIRMLSIGNLYPDESNSGALVEMSEESRQNQSLLFDQLPRPVSFLSADIDNDEKEDFIVCSFGNDIGKFSWYEQNNNSFEETLLKAVSGATQAYAEDLTGNGVDDLVVLFAQGDEGISIFYNEKGSFREEKVLRFPPVYGVNDFEFLDFDGDGDKDIIITNGDNGDHSNILKPYHGLRLFLNDGEMNFTQAYFYPFYGASKVRSRDFDLDGDTDFFVASFFPNFSSGEDYGLVYLENLGKGEFKPYQIEGAKAGRWMVMDAGDIDGDGDEDLVLGSFALNSVGVDADQIDVWRKENIKILFLENMLN